jgi:hypothetical protein
MKSGKKQLGRIAFMPRAGRFDGVQFTLGILTVPSVVNFSTKLASIPGLVTDRGIDTAISRGVASVITLGVHLLTGGSSFGLGSFLGQVPSTLDSLADIAIGEIAAKRQAALPAPAAAPATTQGIARVSGEEAELKRLREELESGDEVAGVEALGYGSHMNVS